MEAGDGVTIHVADAGPEDGPAVMLVHGFPQNWWQRHQLIAGFASGRKSAPVTFTPSKPVAQ